MKTPHSTSTRTALGLLTAVIGLSLQSVSATTYYWDTTGATAGFGTAGGTWAAPTTGSATQGWSTDSTGATLPGNVTTAAATDSLNFGSATAALAAGTITVSGTVSAANFTTPNTSGTITLNGGTVDMGSTTGNFNLGTNGLWFGTTVLTGTGGLTKSGGGQLRLLTAATYTGNTSVTAGSVNLNAVNALPTTTVLSISGSSLVSQAVSGQTLAGLSGTSGTTYRLLTAATGTLTLTGNSSFSGTLSDTAQTLSLVITGGTTTLSGANILYKGTTTVSGGTMLAGSDSLATGFANFTGLTATANSPTMTLASGSLVNGQTVVFTGTTAPTGLTLGTTYFVVNTPTASSSIQVATAANGTAITPTTAGASVKASQVLAGSLGSGNSAIVLGDAATTTNNSSPSLLTGGAFTIGRAVTIANQATSGTYTIGGNTANTSSFGGLVTANQSFTVSQVASGTLNVSGGITGASAGTKTVSFGNVGAVNVSTTGISDGATGNVAITQSGAGTTTLSAANTYTGGTTVSAGTLNVTGSLADTGAVTVNGGTYTVGASDTVGAVTLSSGTISGSGTLTGSSYALQGGALNAVLGTGAITVSTGTTTLGSAGRFNSGSSLTISSGQLTLAGAESVASYVQTGGVLAGTGNTLTSASAYDMQAGSVSAILGGSGIALHKTTAGTVTLNDANTYSGNTTISAGTLALGASGTFANSPVVNLGTSGSQGTLDLTSKSSFAFGSGQTLSGYGAVNIGAGTVTLNGTLAPGNSAGIIAVTGNLALGSASTTNMEIASRIGAAGTAFDQLTVSGALTFNGTLNIITTGLTGLTAGDSFQLFSAGSYTPGFTSVVMTGAYAPAFSGVSGVWTGTDAGILFTFTEATGTLAIAIPEPSSFASLAGLSLLAFASLRRRSRC